MGRIVDLCGEVAAAADEGAEGLVLSPEAWDRLRGEWSDEDIEDATRMNDVGRIAASFSPTSRDSPVIPE